MIVGHLSRFSEGSIVVVARDVWNISRSGFHAIEAEDVGSVHETEIGSAVEHVEVDTAVCRKDVSKDVAEVCLGKSVVVFLEPMVEPARPKLGHEDRRVRSQLFDPFQLGFGAKLEVCGHQLVIHVAPIRRQSWSVRGEQQRFDSLGKSVFSCSYENLLPLP